MQSYSNSYKEEVTAIVAKHDKGNNEPLFEKYPVFIDNHAFRGEYARSLMAQLEQERKQGKPYCGGDFDLKEQVHLNKNDSKTKGKYYRGHEKIIVGMVSTALGHNRLNVVFDSYGVTKVKAPKNRQENKPVNKKTGGISMLNFSKAQEEAISVMNGYQAVMATPGSGKTAVVIEKIATLAKHGNTGILSITHTNTAVNEIKSRIAQTGLTGGIYIKTIHSLCYIIVQNSWNTISSSPYFNLICSEKEKDFADELCKQIVLKDKYTPSNILNIVLAEKKRLTAQEYFEYISCDYEVLAHKIDSEKSINRKIMLECFYKQRKMCSLLLHDLLLLSLHILMENSAERKCWQNKYKYVIVDEFQDLNSEQYEIIELLCEKHGNLCVVGDPNQFIFSWNNASPYRFEQFIDRHKSLVTNHLTMNYRSTEAIVRTANSLISKNTHKNKVLDFRMTAKQTGGARPLYFKAATPIQEAKWIAKQIHSLTEKGVRLKDIAILVRTYAQTGPIESALMENPICYTKKAAEKLFENKVFSNIMAYLKMLTGEDDDAAFLQSINSVPRNFSIKLQEQLEEYSKNNNCSLYQALKIHIKNNNKKTKVMDYVNLIEENMWAYRNLNLKNLTDKIMLESGYEEKIRKSKRDFASYLSIKSIISDISEQYSTKEYIAAVTASKNDCEQHYLDAVQIMTVHAAKGCEWKYVFVAGLTDDIYPLRSWNSPPITQERLEEERNILYVAITRAKKLLYLSSYGNCHGHHCNVSGFVKDMGYENINNVTDLHRRSL